MKRILLSIFATIMTLAFSLRMNAAEDFSYTINWDNPGALSIVLDNISNSPEALDPSATSLVVTRKGYIYLLPAEGYIIKSVTDLNGKSYPISINMNYGGQFVSMSNYGSQNGSVFNVETEKLEKTGEFELDVINGEYALNFYLQNGEHKALSTCYSPELKRGSQTLPLTAYDTEIVVGCDKWNPVYMVKKNGEVATLSSQMSLPVASGDKIEIQAYEVEPERVTLTIEYSEGGEGCINSIFDRATSSLIEYPAIKDKGNVLTFNAGSTLRFNFNEDFIINAITVNGNKVTVPSSGNPYITEVNEDMTILFDATAKVYEDIEGVIYVNGPIEGLRFATGIMDYDVPLTVTGGEELTEDVIFTYSNGKTFTVPAGKTKKYTIMMPGKSRKYFYDSMPGYWVAESILANPIDPDYPIASLAVSADEGPVYLRLGAIANDTKAVVFYDGEEDAAAFYAQNSRFPGRLPVDGIGGTYLRNGYWEIEFDSAYHQSFSVGKAGGSYSNEVLVYLDGNKVKYNDDSMAYTGLKLQEGSVLKVFSVPSGTTPSKHSVKFEIEPGMTVDVKYDLVKDHNPAEDLVCVNKTLVSVKPGANAKVTLDGKSLEANEEGRYEFMTSRSNHRVAVDTEAAVSEIEIDKDGPAVIYNLQGIRITDAVESLPAGIYIVNGQKIIIK